MKILFNLTYLMLLTVLPLNSWTQPVNNDCSSAIELCPGSIGNYSNSGANITFCPDCEDDFSFCFAPNNSIWFTFTTNATGGNVEIVFNNLIFENNPGQDNAIQAAIIEAIVPCDAASYNVVSNCESNGVASVVLTASSLAPLTTYYLVVSGDQSGPGISIPAACTFNLEISGAGIDRPAPSISLTTSSTNICANSPVTANCQAINCPGNGLFRWFIDGNLVSTTSDTFLITSSISDGSIITVETDCYALCPEIVSTNSGAFNVFEFFLDAGADTIVTDGNSVQLNGITGASSYFWSPSFGLSDPTVLNPIVNINETTVFSLTATENGCTQIDQITVSVDDALFFPTTFSPNGDGFNEKWIIEGIENYPNCLVRIFNRWGQEIFQSTSYNATKAWDGTVNDKPIAEGVFYYTVDLNEENTAIYKGSITVIR
jgi:gliding motility-associated-like protein